MMADSFEQWMAAQKPSSFEDWKAQQPSPAVATPAPSSRPSSFEEWKSGQAKQQPSDVGIGPLSMPKRIMRSAIGAGTAPAEPPDETPEQSEKRIAESIELNKQIRELNRMPSQEDMYSKTQRYVTELIELGDESARKQVEEALGKNSVRGLSPPSRDPKDFEKIEVFRPVAGQPEVSFKPIWEYKPPAWRQQYSQAKPTIQAEGRSPQQVVLDEAKLTEGRSFTEKAAEVLDMLFERPAAGAMKGAQEGLVFLVNNWDKLQRAEARKWLKENAGRFRDPRLREVLQNIDAPEGGTEAIRRLSNYVGERVEKSFTGEDPVHFSDSYRGAIRFLKGESGAWMAADPFRPIKADENLMPNVAGFSEGATSGLEEKFGPQPKSVPLDPFEWSASEVGGFITAIGILGKGKFRAPKASNIAKQMEYAMAKGGVSAENLAKFKTISRRIADTVMEAPTQPQRFNQMRRAIRKAAKKLGTDPIAVEQRLMEHVGFHGGGMGKSGLSRLYNWETKSGQAPVTIVTPQAQRAATRQAQKVSRAYAEEEKALFEIQDLQESGLMTRKRAAQESESIAAKRRYIEERAAEDLKAMNIVVESPVPSGAMKTGPLAWRPARAVASEVQFGAGATPGTREALRNARGIQEEGERLAYKASKQLKRRFGDWAKEFVRHRDAKSKLFEERKLLQGARPGSEAAEAIVRGTDDALRELGMTREQAAMPYQFPAGRKGESAREAAQAYIRYMRDLDISAAQRGLDIGHIQSYVPYIETPEVAKWRLREYGADSPVGKEVFGFMKKRVPHEEGVSVMHKTPGGVQRFRTDPSTQLLLRGRAQAVAEAHAQAEADVLGAFAREVPNEWRTPTGDIIVELQRDLKAKGLDLYNGMTGKFAGRQFIMDTGSAKLLSKMVRPDKIDDILKAVNLVHKYWKPRTLLKSLAYTARNFVSNFITMWLHDVNLKRAMSDGFYLDELYGTKTITGVSSKFDNFRRALAEEIAGKDFVTRAKSKFGKWRAEDVVRLGHEHGVPNAGMMAIDVLGKDVMGKPWFSWKSANPVSRQFAPIRAFGEVNNKVENMSRWGTFAHALRNGHSPQEAADLVRLVMLNYDELSRSGEIMLRTVFPFGTWPYKMAGSLANAWLKNPYKFQKYFAAERAYESSDPLTLQEAQYQMMMGEEKGDKGLVRVPRERGPTGERMYQLMGGYNPIYMPNQFDDDVRANLSSMLTPIADLVVNMGELEKQGSFPGHWYTVRQQNVSQLATAPESVQLMMGYARDKSPVIYDKLANVIVPEFDVDEYNRKLSQAETAGMSGDEASKWAAKNTRILRYKWDRDIYDVWQKADPATAQWFLGLWRSSDERTKDEVLNWLTGIKLRSYGAKEADIDYRKEQSQLHKDLADIRRQSEMRGVKYDKRNPVRGFYE